MLVVRWAFSVFLFGQAQGRRLSVVCCLLSVDKTLNSNQTMFYNTKPLYGHRKSGIFFQESLTLRARYCYRRAILTKQP